MDHPKAVRDDTIARIQTLTARLMEQIGASEDARARLIQALEANTWPDVRNAAPHDPAGGRRRG